MKPIDDLDLEMSDISDNVRRPSKDCPFCGQEIGISCYRCPHCGTSLAMVEQRNWERGAAVFVRPEPRTKPNNDALYRFALAICLSLAVFLIVLILIPTSGSVSSSEVAAAGGGFETEGKPPASTDYSQSTGQSFAAASHSTAAPSEAHRQAFVQDIDQPSFEMGAAGPSYQAKQGENQERQNRIEYLTDEIVKDLTKEEAVTADTIVFKAGKPLDCTILRETDTHYSVRHKGLTTLVPKEKILRVERRPKEEVREKLRTIARAEATKIVDNGLVEYGGEWIEREERNQRLEKAQRRLRAKEADAEQAVENSRAEVVAEAIATAKSDFAKLDEGTEVPIASAHGSMIVDVTFSANGKSVRAPMLLDTGASMTSIHPAIAEKLGLVPSGLVQIMFADERVERYPSVTLERVSVQGFSVSGLEVFVAPFGPPGTRGLLGADFLNHFEYGFSPREEVMVMKPLAQR